MQTLEHDVLPLVWRVPFLVAVLSLVLLFYTKRHEPKDIISSSSALFLILTLLLKPLIFPRALHVQPR